MIIARASLSLIDPRGDIPDGQPSPLGNKFLGKAVGVTEGGILSQSLNQMEISCFPTNVPDQVEVNIEHLEINSSISVADITIDDEDIEIPVLEIRKDVSDTGATVEVSRILIRFDLTQISQSITMTIG